MNKICLLFPSRCHAVNILCSSLSALPRGCFVPCCVVLCRVGSCLKLGRDEMERLQGDIRLVLVSLLDLSQEVAQELDREAQAQVVQVDRGIPI